MSAGSTPAKRAEGPSVRRRERRVESVDAEGFLGGWETVLGPGRDASSVDVDEEEDWERAVIRVLTTQMGFVMRTVALPAMAPAIMDSMVVSFLEAREERMAARSKKARVHSYPEEELSVNSLAYGGRIWWSHSSSIQSL